MADIIYSQYRKNEDGNQSQEWYYNLDHTVNGPFKSWKLAFQDRRKKINKIIQEVLEKREKTE